jgi:hypothetical protein
MPSYSISIPQPCHENWQEMTAVEQGRFCKACQTVVTDFTGLSDDEIITHLKKAAGGKMCGRFLNTQTERALLPEIKVHRISRFRKMAATVMLFYATIHEATAQTPEASAYSTTVKKVSEKPTGIIIEGQIKHYTSQNQNEEFDDDQRFLSGINGLELEIQGLDLIQITDKYGRFKFQLPDSCAFHEFTLSPTKIGMAYLDRLSEYMPPNVIRVDTIPFKTAISITVNRNYFKDQVVVSACHSSIGIVRCDVPTYTIRGGSTIWSKIRYFFSGRWSRVYRKLHKN